MAFDTDQGFARTITSTFTKGDGTPGTVDGVPVWTAAPDGLATLTPSADGMTCEVVWAGAGDVTITQTADGDLGAGVHPIVSSVIITMVAPLGAVAGALGVSDAHPAP
jgi:hypothetical protein